MTGDKLTFTQDHQVSIPAGEQMMIDTDDWARIRISVERLGEPLTDYASGFAAILLGAAITLLGIIVSVKVSNSSPTSGLRAGVWVSFGFCLFFALCFFLIGQREKRRYGVSNRALCRDMDDCARRAGHDGLGVEAPTPRLGIKAMALSWWRGD
jgi:hypothetical protein